MFDDCDDYEGYSEETNGAVQRFVEQAHKGVVTGAARGAGRARAVRMPSDPAGNLILTARGSGPVNALDEEYVCADRTRTLATH